MNPYLISSTTDRETEFTRALTYWLSPYESHGLSSLPSTLFIKVIAEVARKQSEAHEDLQLIVDDPAQAVQAEVRFDLETPVDLLITTKRAQLLVEMKLWSPEGKNQLERYVQLADAKKSSKGLTFVIFITPTGRTPTSIDEKKKNRIVCVSFQDLDGWIGHLMGASLNFNQLIGLSQFRDWIRYIIQSSSGSRTSTSFDKNLLGNFWNKVSQHLTEHLAKTNYLGWTVRFSNEKKSMVKDGPYLDGSWSKLGYCYEDEKFLKHPLVIFEGIEGLQSGCFGVRRPLQYQKKMPGTETEEVSLLDVLSGLKFRKDADYFGISYFNSNGWPGFQPNDNFTRAALSDLDLSSEISQQMADALFFLLSKTHKQLETITFE